MGAEAVEPLSPWVDLHLAVADALTRQHHQRGEVVHGPAQVGGAVQGAGVGVKRHRGQLAGATVVAKGCADGQPLVPAVQVGGGLFALGLAPGEGFPERGPLGAG